MQLQHYVARTLADHISDARGGSGWKGGCSVLGPAKEDTSVQLMVLKTLVMAQVCVSVARKLPEFPCMLTVLKFYDNFQSVCVCVYNGLRSLHLLRVYCSSQFDLSVMPPTKRLRRRTESNGSCPRACPWCPCLRWGGPARQTSQHYLCLSTDQLYVRSSCRCRSY